jgi:hypothetical protein
MKNILLIIILIISLNIYSQDTVFIDYQKSITIENYIKLKKLLPKSKNYNFSNFLFDLAVYESSGNWKAKNGDHIGLWQMGTMSRKDISNYMHNIDNFSSKDFENNPYLYSIYKQKESVIYHTIWIEKNMIDYIEKYKNTYINDIFITKSGIIAACHLVGVGSVKKYLDSNGKNISLDGNETSIEEYLINFWHYNF